MNFKKFYLSDDEQAKFSNIRKFVEDNSQTHADFSFLTDNTNNKHICTISANSLIDIEIEDTIKELNCTYLKGSMFYFGEIVKHPLNNKDSLVKRQQIIKDINEKNHDCGTMFKRLAELESDVLWFLRTKEQDIDSLFEVSYFKLLSFLNHSDKSLFALNTYRIALSPTIGLLSPFIYVIVPLLIVKIKCGRKIGLHTLIKLFFNMMVTNCKFLNGSLKYLYMFFVCMFYFQGLFNSFEISAATYKMTSYISKKVSSILEFSNIASRFVVSSEFLQHFGLTQFEQFHSDSFISFYDFGKMLVCFKTLDANRIRESLKTVYAIDAIVSIPSIRGKFNFTETQFVENEDGRELIFDELWHPNLGTSVVNNNIHLENQRNMLITGPNAGGKSTLLKSLAIATVLSQSLTIAPARKCVLTPFRYISCQITKKDSKGVESLFEHEMNVAKKHFDIIDHINSQPALIIIDEIFSSTNPFEGIAGAYSIAKHLGKKQNVLAIISTHFTTLAMLEKEHNYTNFRMNIKLPEFVYPYKLERGVSRQYVALELLKRNDFDNIIINDAIEMKEKLVATN